MGALVMMCPALACQATGNWQTECRSGSRDHRAGLCLEPPPTIPAPTPIPRACLQAPCFHFLSKCEALVGVHCPEGTCLGVGPVDGGTGGGPTRVGAGAALTGPASARPHQPQGPTAIPSTPTGNAGQLFWRPCPPSRPQDPKTAPPTVGGATQHARGGAYHGRGTSWHGGSVA